MWLSASVRSANTKPFVQRHLAIERPKSELDPEAARDSDFQ
jgi:hypothetical protein